MIRNNRKGQALLESLGALWFLLILFFCLYYIFLMGIDKIRSLDTVYQMARIQQVRPEEGHTRHFLATALLCFGVRPYWTQIDGRNSYGTPVSEVTFRFFHNFAPLLGLHRSIMRVAQPNSLYLTKSYPNAREDINESGLNAKLAKETLILVGQAHLSAELVGKLDFMEDSIAKLEESLL